MLPVSRMYSFSGSFADHCLGQVVLHGVSGALIKKPESHCARPVPPTSWMNQQSLAYAKLLKLWSSRGSFIQWHLSLFLSVTSLNPTSNILHQPWSVLLFPSPKLCPNSFADDRIDWLNVQPDRPQNSFEKAS
jgi:hypothetical protein